VAEQNDLVIASSIDQSARKLHLLGLNDEQIAGIPDEPGAQISRYALYAPARGQIVRKHITPGESVDTREPVYTIAELDTVWLNISVYSKYASQIGEGQHVVILTGDRMSDGVIDYVSATTSEPTQTVAARVVIDNQKRLWKPGEYVTARVETGHSVVERLVPLDAIQSFEGRNVVFVQDIDGIEPVPVMLGRRSDVSVEILGNDIPLGTPVVVRNSFLMKAELGKSAAGHDH